MTWQLPTRHQTFDDFQVNTFAGTAFMVETLSDVIPKGVDADFIWFTPIEQKALTVVNARAAHL